MHHLLIQRQPIESFVQKGDAFRPYTLILITAPITSDVLTAISTYSQKNHIPIIYIHSVGFYSHFSVSLPPAFPVVDTHPDPSTTTDLRLLKPWPALDAFAKEKTADLASLSEHDLGHVPYVLLLLHYIQKWKDAHDGHAPLSYKEKTEFRDLLRTSAPHPDEENYAEAVAAVLKSLNPPTPPTSVLETLNAPEAQTINLGPTTASFWFIANAIKTFYHENGELPLPGAVPDMKAQSVDYIRLQNIYKARARHDVGQVLHTVRELEKAVGRSQNDAIDEKEVEAFCKGAAHVKLVRGRPLLLTRANKKVEWGSIASQSAAMALMMPSETGILLLIAFLAWDTFVGSHASDNLSGDAKIPGATDNDVETDSEKTVGIALNILDEVINEAATFIENPEYDQLKEDLQKIVREL